MSQRLRQEIQENKEAVYLSVGTLQGTKAKAEHI